MNVTLQPVKVINNYLSEDGEIIDTNQEEKIQVVSVTSEEEFYWTYLSVQSLLDKIDKVGFKVLFYAMMNCQWNKNLISFTKPIIEDMATVLILKPQSIRNSISLLKKRGILISRGSGTYQIHPKYFWKGNKHERNRALKYILQVEFDGVSNSSQSNQNNV